MIFKIRDWLMILIVFISVPLQVKADLKEDSSIVNKMYTLKQLQEDFVILRQALEEGHAGLHRYCSKENMDSNFGIVSERFKKSLTEMDFFRLLLPLIGKINDGHTGINLSKTYMKYLEDQTIVFPFKLRFAKKRAYLYRNYSEDMNILMGGELLSINGQSVSGIIEKLLPLIPSDAGIKTAKWRKLESTGFFGLSYTFLFGETRSFSIVVRHPLEKAIDQVKVKGIKIKDLNQIFKKRYPEAAKEKKPITLEYKYGIPVLTIRTFAGSSIQRAGINYADFLKKSFSEFENKKIKNLIIDLRDNGGGSDQFGKLLFAYLIDKPFSYYRALETKKNKFQFFKYTSLTPAQQKLPPGQFKKNQRGWYDVQLHPNLGQQNPLKPTFKGKVYVLLNGRSFSATGETTSMMHFYKKAIFVGEECGAGYYGNTSGFMPTLILPNTKIRVRIPLVRYTMAVSGYPNDQGLRPDIPVYLNIEDIMQKLDTVLLYILNKIRREKK